MTPALLLLGFAASADADADFFEKRVRPVLVEHCYKCHSDQGKNPKGGLRVDGRARLLAGGDGGPAIVPGDPDKSPLIRAVRYTDPDLLMPPKGKLPRAAVADLEAWVKAGAPWPGAEAKPTLTAKEFNISLRVREHWSWRPVRPTAVPDVKNTSWPTDAIDRFVLAKLEAKNLHPAPPADPSTWLRRVTFALTGLPPKPDDIESFLQSSIKNRQSAMRQVVDRLLASPAYGERWGRHWLDLVRYADTRGHEFDHDIPQAWQYRDSVVRALDANVPYDRLVLEHVAGDCLPDPRIGPDGANESILGTGFWHLGEEVHSPVDIRQDQADRLDNRIDVFSKAFLGLTVSCARCHDHKFDAISTKDFYALFGLLEGSSYRQVRFDGWQRNRAVAAELAKLRDLTSAELAGLLPPAKLDPAVDPAYQNWLSSAKVVVDYAELRPGDWLPDDVTYGPGPRPAGAATITKSGVRLEDRTAAVFDRFWAGLTATADSQTPDPGAIGRRPRVGFTLRTPTFAVERNNLYYLVRGGGTAYAAVCGHTLVAGPLHGELVKDFKNGDDYRWVAQPVAGYRGQPAHVELTADPISDFAVAMVVQADAPPPTVPQSITRVVPDDTPGLTTIRARVAATEAELARRVVWKSRLAPALLDGTGIDERVFVRGNPRTPGEPVPRRMLEAIAGPDRVPHDRGSGRLELARQVIDPARNPYLGRVAVNRVWHHLFGRGIVATPDNFGVLGEPPTHPELLDYLADEFVRDGWSLKRLIRRLVLTSAYAMSSTLPEVEADPGNDLLFRFRLKRLEAEAIRDAMLSVSGRLDLTLGGPPVPAYLTDFQGGRGKPKESGPLDGAGRRSLYLSVRRNFLSPFLAAFDQPTPASTVGRRQVSNVPAQGLTLLNDPFAHLMADEWGKRLAKQPGSSDETARRMWLAAFGRPPTDAEAQECRGFVAGREADPSAWAELAHALFNVKEFVFIR